MSDSFKFFLQDHMLKLRQLSEMIKQYEEKQSLISLLQRLSISNTIFTDRTRCGKVHHATVSRRITPIIVHKRIVQKRIGV